MEVAQQSLKASATSTCFYPHPCQSRKCWNTQIDQINTIHPHKQPPSLMRSTRRPKIGVCPRCIDAVLQQELCNTTMIVLTSTACLTTCANLWMITLEPKAETAMFQNTFFRIMSCLFFPSTKDTFHLPTV